MAAFVVVVLVSATATGVWLVPKTNKLILLKMATEKSAVWPVGNLRHSPFRGLVFYRLSSPPAFLHINHRKHHHKR
jgi:hypothetical protein